MRVCFEWARECEHICEMDKIESRLVICICNSMI